MLAKILFLFARWCVEAIVVPCNKHKQVKFSYTQINLRYKLLLAVKVTPVPVVHSGHWNKTSCLRPTWLAFTSERFMGVVVAEASGWPVCSSF